MKNFDYRIELLKAKADVLKLKRKALHLENEALRTKLQFNAEQKRQIQRELAEIDKELNPRLPF